MANKNNKGSNHQNIQTIDSTTLKILDEFVKDNRLDRKEGTTLVFSKNLDELRAQNGSVELLLNYLAGNYGSLFYGSPKNITGFANGYLLRPNGNGILCLTNLGAAAIINSLVNKDRLSPPGIKIPSQIDSEHPFKAEIYGLNKKALNEDGFVYVINNKEGFEKIVQSSWQFINRTGNPVQINAKIPVNNYDFKYPINDISNNIKEKRLDVDFGRKYY